MKMVKNISIVALAASFMFAGVGFHYANNYTNMDGGTEVATSWGVSYALNDNTSLGWDSSLGMLMNFEAPMGVTLRLGWTASASDSCVDDNGDAVDGIASDTACTDAADTNVWTAGSPANTLIGLGFTWWTGGTGVKTSISTNFDYAMEPAAGEFNASTVGADWEANYSNLSVVVGFGF